MRMKNRVLALAVVACATFGSSVYATDSKVIPGTACQPIQADLVTGITRRGTFFNQQGENIGIDCPIVRDNNATSSGAVSAQVRVNGRGQKVSCILSSYDRSGAVLDSDTGESTATFPDTIVLSISNGVSRGAYSISCDLPDQGELINYTVTELTPTDDNN